MRGDRQRARPGRRERSGQPSAEEPLPPGAGLRCQRRATCRGRRLGGRTAFRRPGGAPAPSQRPARPAGRRAGTALVCHASVFRSGATSAETGWAVLRLVLQPAGGIADAGPAHSTALRDDTRWLLARRSGQRRCRLQRHPTAVRPHRYAGLRHRSALEPCRAAWLPAHLVSGQTMATPTWPRPHRAARAGTGDRLGPPQQRRPIRWPLHLLAGFPNR